MRDSDCRENRAEAIVGQRRATTCGGGVTGMVGRRVHHVVLGEVICAEVTTEPRGRADAAIFELKDLGE